MLQNNYSKINSVNKKWILVYNDTGTSPYCVQETITSLQTVLEPARYLIKTIDKQIVNNTAWESSTALFVMPGGRSKPFHDDLAGHGKGNEKIINFVTNGGHYLGICAGGYYGCQKTEFEIGQPLEIKLDGALNFFPGIAYGPAYELGKFSYDNNAGAKLAQISLVDNKNKIISKHEIYYNGGAYFIFPDNDTRTTVLARYTDIKNSPAAIIHCKVGTGSAILTGIHPEYSHHAVAAQPHPDKSIYDTLKNTEQQRLELFTLLLKTLLGH